MKKIFALILALVMAGTLAVGCGGSGTNSSPAPGSAPPASGASSAPPAASGTSSAPPAASGTSSAPPAAAASYILRIGTGTGGTHPQNIWMQAFKDSLEQATNGQIEVQLYPAGQLGSMAELVQGLVDGSVDSGVFPTSYFSTIIPAVACTDISFTFKDAEQLWRILFNNDTKYQAAFEDNGIIVGTWLRNCDRTIISTSPINSISDIKGKILWCTPSKVIQQEITLLGGIPSSIDVGELAPAIQNGTVNGSIQDISLYRSQSLQNSGAKYLLMAPKDPLITCFGISKTWWDKLPADLQSIVLDTAKQTVLDVEYPYVDQYVQEAYSTMGDGGLQVVEPSDQLWADMKTALAGQKDWFMNLNPDAAPMYDELCQLVAADNAANGG